MNDRAQSLGWPLVVALLAGSGSAVMVPQLKPDLVRPHPFTSLDAQTMRDGILAELARRLELSQVAHELDLERLEASIRRDMPPAPTRIRIEALEEMVERLARQQGWEFTPPSIYFAAPFVAPQGEGSQAAYMVQRIDSL